MQLNNKGFFIIETFIGLAVGLMITLGAIAFLSAISKSTSDTMHNMALEHEMHTTLSLISQDIRRAGFDSMRTVALASGKTQNPFMQTDSDLRLPTSTCLLLSYDKNGSGLLPPLNTSPSDNRFGYRLANQQVETRANHDAFFSCDEGQWDSLTNSKLIEITALNFALSTNALSIEGSSASLIQRTVSIRISGRLIRDPSITKTLITQIRVRNDCLQA